VAEVDTVVTSAQCVMIKDTWYLIQICLELWHSEGWDPAP
jgi:hypothetical protein